MGKSPEATKPGEAAPKCASVHGRWYGDACAATFAMELVGERWALPIARELMLGPLRFTDIRAALPQVSAKTLTERLEWLETVGVIERATLPPPSGARVYGLTQWGRGLEAVLQELGRWAVQSPLHDPLLPFSPVSFLLSLRTMLNAEAAAALRDLWVALAIGGRYFAGRLRGGALGFHRAAAPMPAPDLRFTAPDATSLLPLFYHGAPLDALPEGVAVEGDPALATRFLALFALPTKISA